MNSIIWLHRPVFRVGLNVQATLNDMQLERPLYFFNTDPAATKMMLPADGREHFSQTNNKQRCRNCKTVIKGVFHNIDAARQSFPEGAQTRNTHFPVDFASSGMQ